MKSTLYVLTALVFAALALGLGGCIEDPNPAPDPSGAEGEADAGPPADASPDALPPDPDYRRTCERGDFDCNFDQCTGAGTDGPLGCFKPCEPATLDAVGQPHPDCDEPERPFCSEVGLWQGGDYACNGCVYLCTAEPAAPACERDALRCW